MTLGRPEKHPVRDDRRASASDPEHPQEQGNEQKLGLLRVDDRRQ